MLVATAQRVDVVDQQDRVADDDAREHDDADVGLHAERRCWSAAALPTTPIAASGIENMMMNGSRSDSYCDAITA
mgnify:CR=1 FL=1